MELTSPHDVAVGFMEAWNDHDPDALADLFVEDADFVNVVGLWWEDRRAIRRAHARGFRVMFGRSTMRLLRTKVRMLSDEAAVLHASWAMAGQVGPEQEPAGARSGVFTFVVERQTVGGWRAVAAQNTDRVDGAETHVAGETLAATDYIGSRPIGRQATE